MAEISVDTGGMRTQESHLQSIINHLGKAETELNSVNNKIARYLESRAYQNVRKKISQMSERVIHNKESVQLLKTTLASSRELYQNTEDKIATYFAKSSIVDWSQTSDAFSGGGSGGEGGSMGGTSAEKSSNGILDSIKNWLNDVKDDEEEEALRKILGAVSSLGGVKEAGILKNISSYIKDFATFFTGDKKGLTGASDWCSLTKSSINVWKGVYDYYAKAYKGLKTGFFGESAQKNVGILGLTGGGIGLIGSILSASDGLGKKKWQSVVADYIGSGKDIITMVQSGYKLKHIGDTKSLANIKAGPWSALNMYAAVGNIGVEVTSQLFRSIEKYTKDNKWDLNDTAATGIDISIAGLYGFTHTLTFGLDDVIFGAVDKWSGGNGNDDMSYIEKAAEGYKILGEKIGKNIGNFLKNLKK